MTHLPPLGDAEAGPEAKAIFAELQSRLGAVPNMYRTFGHAPHALQAVVGLVKAVRIGLDAKLRELAYLKTVQMNGCPY